MTKLPYGGSVTADRDTVPCSLESLDAPRAAASFPSSRLAQTGIPVRQSFSVIPLMGDLSGFYAPPSSWQIEIPRSKKLGGSSADLV
jgi:hypothetical protein